MFTTSDWLIAATTLLGPILAVQAQKWIEISRAARARRSDLFHTLMATRGARLSPEHVRALNMIDLTFYGSRFIILWRSSSTKAVLEAWKEYHDHLSQGLPEGEGITEVSADKLTELFINLLHAMAKNVGYKFDRVELKKSWYSPNAYANIEKQQTEVRNLVLKILSGESPIQVDIKSVPKNPVGPQQ